MALQEPSLTTAGQPTSQQSQISYDRLNTSVSSLELQVGSLNTNVAGLQGSQNAQDILIASLQSAVLQLQQTGGYRGITLATELQALIDAADSVLVVNQSVIDLEEVESPIILKPGQSLYLNDFYNLGFIFEWTVDDEPTAIYLTRCQMTEDFIDGLSLINIAGSAGLVSLVLTDCRDVDGEPIDDLTTTVAGAL